MEKTLFEATLKIYVCILQAIAFNVRKKTTPLNQSKEFTRLQELEAEGHESVLPISATYRCFVLARLIAIKNQQQ